MTATALQPLQTAPAAAPISGGESAAFWIIGTIVVLAALGVVFSRKAVYSALMMAVVMIGLAVFYGINQAPFLMVVQIVVYTGAVLMLFLFVLMLVGVTSSDSLVETIKGQRLLAAVVAICFLGAVATGMTRITLADPVGLDAGVAAAGGSIPWIAGEIIYRYIIAFEATGALLITAVLGGLVMAHTERVRRKRTQKEMSKERIRGDHPTPLPGPGTYARHNAIDMPALLPDGSVSELSLNPVLAARDPRDQSQVPRDIRLGTGAVPGGASDSAWSKEGHEAGDDGAPGDNGDDDGENGGREADRSWTR
ncbi:NADH-quinone oxidoreductase subunit J [Spinactinospora alkalitolerans]|uniref:NADH-quinone oxidoreductase subunit J n=1 Tax=Spinactinospora alkalitolerans TaxID=687207 RepID=A0A852U4S6_9ACTN|nr:NADH-quinone oxidoreductase subunit J [Spinactinospora alkalitolerans]NYE49903.1 NADH-quinone oxidoreductase subunit J [Spinactinospora alkalitolerans]